MSLLSYGGTVEAQLSWPAVTSQTKPWARWWWEGSAVDEKNLTAVMELYKAAGLGGLEVTPIYGVKGEESKDILFLSKRWMQVFDHTLQEGKRLGLGIDLANATGWPFGGPWVLPKDASKSFEVKKFEIKRGAALSEPIKFMQAPLLRTENKSNVKLEDIKRPVGSNGSPTLQKWGLNQVRFAEELPLICLMAYNAEGKAINLTDKVDSKGHLNWSPSDGDYQLYALFEGQHGKMVERAAPGGEGFVIDHFAASALDGYLGHFDSAFNGHSLSGLRGYFNDSYEVDDASGEADYTPLLFKEFKALHGYDLRSYLPLLLDKDNKSEKASRVLSDYRETIGDLLLKHFTERWEAWGKAKGKQIRNQSHGSPANILDLYAAIDIPETEGTDELRFKFASSATNVTGKPLTSSESATWLKDHFQASLADVKKVIDLYFIGGVNHIFYHGVAYSPVSATWPGWLFYAAVHFQPTNPQWRNFSTLNQYITNTQSFLQNSKVDNDILQYYPIFDSYADRGRTLLKHYDGMNGFAGTAFYDNANWMNDNGYSFDFISDHQLQQLDFDAKGINSKGAHYQTILLSSVTHMPDQSFEKIMNLVKAGATVLVYNHLPSTVPGLGNLEKRQANLTRLLQQLSFTGDEAGVQEASYGKGRVLKARNLDQLLVAGKVTRESLGDQASLKFIRRSNEKGVYYFINNRSDKAFEGFVKLGKKGASSYALFDAMTHQSGLAITKSSTDGDEVYLQLKPWSAIIIQASKSPLKGQSFAYTQTGEQSQALNGPWTVSFKEGGPTLPKTVQMEQLKLWSDLADTSAQNFSGTAEYSTDFKRPASGATTWRLSLGEVHENAEVFLNGQRLGTLIGPDFSLDFDAGLLKAQNHLTVKVSNLMANRIRYMDRNGIVYKRFYNINFSAHDAENRGKDGLFTTKNWDVYPSGIKGPVVLTPLQPLKK